MENYHNPHDEHHSELDHSNDASAFWMVLTIITFLGILMIYLGMS